MYSLVGSWGLEETPGPSGEIDDVDLAHGLSQRSLIEDTGKGELRDAVHHSPPGDKNWHGGLSLSGTAEIVAASLQE